MINKSFVSLFIALIFNSCTTDSPADINNVTPEMSIEISPVINGKKVNTSQYYSLSGGDSILMSRLDFYIQHTEIFNKSQAKKSNFDTAILFSLSNQKNIMKISKSTMPSTIDSIQFLCGLDDFTNGKDPNIYPNNHPLSSWKNMYWTWASKYRFVVFEGNIKRSNGTVSNFSYHTGLEYKNYGSTPTNITLNTSTPKIYSLKLDLKKVFFPNSRPTIDYVGGELQAHGDPSDASLTDKFAKNFAAAFTFE